MNFFEDRKIKKIARDEDIKAPDKYLKSVEQTLNDLKKTYSRIKFSIYQVFKTTKFHMNSSREFPHPQYITPSNCYEEYEL